MTNMIQNAKDQAAALAMAAYKAAAADGTLPEAEVKTAPVEIPKDTANGDYTTTFALAAAKALGKPPRVIAQALLDVFLRFGKAHQLAFLTLEVRASNDPAKQLYMKHGFEQVGRRKDYYDEPNEDAIIMTKYFQAEQPDENDE